MSRTVAHVYRNPRVPLAARYAGLDKHSTVRHWAENCRWRSWFADPGDLSAASTRHILRYRRNSGDRTVKERPEYVRKSVAPHDYNRVVYDRGNRVTVLKHKKHRSNRTTDRMGSREALKLAGSREDLTECFGDHWTRHSALWDS